MRILERMQEKNLAEPLGCNECSINGSHARLAISHKLGASPGKFVPYPNYKHPHALTRNVGLP